MFVTKDTLPKLNLRFVTEADITDKEITESELRALDMIRFEDYQVEMSKTFVDFTRKATKDLAAENQDTLEKYNRILRICEGDHLAAINTLMYTDHQFRAEYNQLQGDNPRCQVDYSVTAARAGAKEFKAYRKASEQFRAAVVSTANPGVANTVDTTVSQAIMYRAENIGQILPEISKITIPYGDYEMPFYNKYSLGGYLSETGTVPDIQGDLDDATNGIKKTKWTPRDFALLLEQSFRTITKLSPAVLSQIFGFVAIALNSGMEYQAVSGPGTGQNESGMLTVATSVAFNGNAYLTSVDACSLVGSRNVVKKIMVMNERAWGEFKKLRVINKAYGDSIDSQKKMVDDVRVIVVPESTIPTVSNATSVLVGDLSHYLAVTTGELKEYILDNGKSLNRQTTYHVLRDARAIFTDSFAKFSLTVS